VSSKSISVISGVFIAEDVDGVRDKGPGNRMVNEQTLLEAQTTMSSVKTLCDRKNF
jgi:aspartokinase-like uncharacterized kinase